MLIIKVQLLIQHQNETDWHIILYDVWACLFWQCSSNLGKIFETAPRISLSTFIPDLYLLLMTAIADNPASHR